MKISRAWLQTYFDSPLPASDALADALTFHAFEIESVEGDILEVKVTANRGHDCLSHRGIAKELSAILSLPLKDDPLSTAPSLAPGSGIEVVIDEPELCARYIACRVRGVKVGPSPRWLAERLESIGQKSINNVVDAANFVMFDVGQPLHAFDAGKLSAHPRLAVRLAERGDKLVGLDDKTHELPEGTLVIADAGSILGIAGIKGGRESGVSAHTTDLILEAANFDGPSLRRASRALKLRTDASQRFEQVISPELAAYGMRAFAALVQKIAGGEIVGFTDVYPHPRTMAAVTVSRLHINQILGLELSESDVENVFTRLGFEFQELEEHYVVTPPFERLDLALPEDLIEEVGRIIGYDRIPPAELPAPEGALPVHARAAREDVIRSYLCGEGFTEVVTSVFADSGERIVANKADGTRPYLRDSLVPGLRDALERNIRNKDLLGIAQVKIFEIGTVWKDGGEKTEVAIAVETMKKQKPEAAYRQELDAFIASIPSAPEEAAPAPLPDIRYQPFSRYPFIVRDVALWVPEGTSAEEVLSVIRAHAGELLVRSAKFDEFAKDGRVSFAFRLVFQSFDRTLTDEDAHARMESIYAALRAQGWEVR